MEIANKGMYKISRTSYRAGGVINDQVMVVFAEQGCDRFKDITMDSEKGNIRNNKSSI